MKPFSLPKSIALTLFFIVFSLGCEINRLEPVEEVSFNSLTEKFITSDIEQQYSTEINSISKSQLRTLKAQRTFNRNIYWKAAFYQKIGNDFVMLVPFSLQEEIFQRLEDSTYIEYSNTSYFKVSKVNNKYTFEIVTKIPDAYYLSTNMDGNEKKFSGTIIVEDLQGNYIKGYKISPDGETYELSKNQSGNSTTNRLAASKDYCYYVDWYTCGSSAQGDEVYCSYNYTEEYCTTTSVGGGTEYSQLGEYAVSGGSYYNSTNVNFETNVYLFKLCPPLKWGSVGNSYTSQINGLGITAVDFDTKKVINVNLGTCCISVPKYGLQAYDAAVIFAQAYNLARAEIQIELNETSLIPNHSHVRTRLITLITAYLQAVRGAATFSVAACKGTIPLNVADYSC